MGFSRLWRFFADLDPDKSGGGLEIAGGIHQPENVDYETGSPFRYKKRGFRDQRTAQRLFATEHTESTEIRPYQTSHITAALSLSPIITIRKTKRQTGGESGTGFPACEPAQTQAGKPVSHSKNVPRSY